MKNTLYSLVFQ